VQKILGHSDANITAKVYAHLVPGFLKSAVKRLQIGKTLSAARNFGQPVVSTATNSRKIEGPAPVLAINLVRTCVIAADEPEGHAVEWCS